MNSLIVLGLVSSSIGLAGYKYYKYCEADREYEKLLESFRYYDSDKLIIEHSERLDDEYAPFRVIYFESVCDIDLP